MEEIELPRSNVIKFILQDGSWICLRPSGTEPKLKIYAGVKGSTLDEGREDLVKTISWMEERIREI